MKSKVYFSRTITPKKVLELYKMIGTVVECNTAYEGSRNTEKHWQTIRESRNGVHTIEAASELGYGCREYELIEY